MRGRETKGKRERERVREYVCALQVHLARILRKGSDPLTRVKLPHSLPRGHCILDDRKFIEFFRTLCLGSRAFLRLFLCARTARTVARRLGRALLPWAPRENR